MKMSKVQITRSESIPFREANWEIMQMKQYELSITLTQEEESVEQLEQQLWETFDRNMKKMLEQDPVYVRQRKQLQFLVEQIRKHNPDKAKEIILSANKIHLWTQATWSDTKTE